MFNFNFMALLYAIPVILISLSFHEAAHAFVSYKLGDPTAKRMGRLTINPLKHLDPVGTLMMIVSMGTGMGFGWAKPVPIDPSYYKNHKRGTILTSIAGPVSNLLLAFISVFPLVFMLFKFDIDAMSKYNANVILFNFLKNFFLTNINLAIFNLIPVPPLDGSKILSGILPERLYFKFMQYENYVGIVFLAIVLLLPDQFSQVLGTVTMPIYKAMINVAAPVISLFFGG